MTDNEIIKALECRAKSFCEPCRNKNCDKCIFDYVKQMLNLIKHQKAEIERLQKENNQFADIGKMYSEIKAEAVKEFAKKLKEIITMSPKNSILIDKWYIDNLVKEMVGEGHEE